MKTDINARKFPNIIFPMIIWKLVLIAWVCLWAGTITKDLFVKHNITGYGALLCRPSLEQKRAYITGDRLYELIAFAVKNIPENATFGYQGIDLYSESDRKCRYYLYPRSLSEDPDYLIVFDKTGFKDAFVPFMELDAKRYILKKTE